LGFSPPLSVSLSSNKERKRKFRRKQGRIYIEIATQIFDVKMTDTTKSHPKISITRVGGVGVKNKIMNKNLSSKTLFFSHKSISYLM